MKTPRIVYAVGLIDDDLIAAAAQSKVTKRSIWLRWGALAACLCVIAVAVFVTTPSLTPEEEADPFSITVAYAGWSDDPAINDGALNKDFFLDNSAPTAQRHLPLFAMDTLAELEEFKSKYGGILSMEQGYNESLSFNAALAKAQFDREEFFEDSTLIVVYVTANSGSYRFSTKEIVEADGALQICVEQKNDPEICTDDMAGWFIIVSVADERFSGYTSVDAVLVN